MKVNTQVIQLKNNCLTKGLIPVKFFFDQNDVAKTPRINSDVEEAENCNLGTAESPKFSKWSNFPFF